MDNSETENEEKKRKKNRILTRLYNYMTIKLGKMSALSNN